MSEEVVHHHAPKTEEYGQTTTLVKEEPETVEKQDRGLFDFLGKKEEEKKCEDTAISSEFEQKVHVSESEPKPEEKHETLFQKMHKSHSNTSSSSDEEEEVFEDGELKKKKKKKEKVKKHEEDTCVPIEKYEEVAVAPPPTTEAPIPQPEEKKGFMEKIKEKLPGGHKKADESPPPTPAVVPAPAPAPAHEAAADTEKKGIFEKIKEKIPGYHSKTEEEKEKEKVKECD